jgi:hypothetical protein
MRSVTSVLLLLMLSGIVTAQTASTLHLSDYVGTYTDAPGHTLEIVDGDGLFAVLDGAKYKLRPSGADQFNTITGQTIPFLRDANGKVTGYEEDGKFHARVSSAVTPESAALARPRPQGQDAPSDYRYRPPADLHDGIAVGDITRSGLGTATADAIVRGILDGTYKDVHSILLYQHGKLVMEEYFYGYSVGRTHQLRVQLAAQGSPIAGDDLYGPPFLPGAASSAERVLLHAAELELRRADGSWLRVEAEPPADFAGAV